MLGSVTDCSLRHLWKRASPGIASEGKLGSLWATAVQVGLGGTLDSHSWLGPSLSSSIHPACQPGLRRKYPKAGIRAATQPHKVLQTGRLEVPVRRDGKCRGIEDEEWA